MTALLLKPAQPLRYGAKELQIAIEKNTYKSLMYTMAGIVLFAIASWLMMGAVAPPTIIPYYPTGTEVILTTKKQEPQQQQNTNGQQEQQHHTSGGEKQQVDNPLEHNIVASNKVDSIADQKITPYNPDGDGTDKLPSGEGPGNGKTEGPGTTTTPNTTIVDHTGQIFESIDVEIEPSLDLGELLRNVEYPEMARSMGVEGYVVVKTLIAADGQVQQAIVEDSQNSLLNTAALNAVKRTHFSPAKQGGQSVACWMLVPIKFKLR